MGSESGPASARPMITAATETAATSRAGAEQERAREEGEAAHELESAVEGERDAAGHAIRVADMRPDICEGGHRPCSVPPVPRVRLDSLLAERGLFPSRTRAAAAVMAGQVRLGPGDARAAKPGQLVDPDVQLGVDAPPPYV